jgi:hypothetical protein
MESYSWVDKFIVSESLPKQPSHFPVNSYYDKFINLFVIRSVAILTLVVGHIYTKSINN